MTQAIIPLIATMAIGTIVGITTTHFKHVEHIVTERTKVSSEMVGDSVSNAPDTSQRESIQVDHSALKSSTLANDHIPYADPPILAGHSAREDALLKLLAEQTRMLGTMRAEQKILRKQLSETNRDMDELTFRVDAHSDDFRPLRVGGDTRPRQLIDISSDSPDSGQAGGLLPPKR